METAGKFVEDEELRAALKENGIGRPSSRAGIIETLFKRHYIRRERKNLLATATGIELIDIIHEELLKSCELTGIWEKKLREIEHLRYNAPQFIEELKQQITEIVSTVMHDNSNRRVTIITEEDLKKKKKAAPRKKSATPASPSAATAAKPATTSGSNASTTSTPAAGGDNTASGGPSATPTPSPEGQVCPLCGQGIIIKGHAAYGCSRWREGCTYRKPF